MKLLLQIICIILSIVPCSIGFAVALIEQGYQDGVKLCDEMYEWITGDEP